MSVENKLLVSKKGVMAKWIEWPKSGQTIRPLLF